MLTLPMLIFCWFVAAVNFLAMFYWIFKGQGFKWRWLWVGLNYFFTGFFAIAIPFKIALAATSPLGMIFLSVIWPIWLGQNLGYSVLDWAPDSFWSFMFNFK